MARPKLDKNQGPVIVSADAVARLAGTQSAQRMPRVERGKCDLRDPVVWEFVTRDTVRAAVEAALAAAPDASSREALEKEKIAKDIELKTAQIEKVRLATEQERGALVPASMVGLWIGHFTAEIRTNLLTLGRRIAGDDPKLRERIDGFVKRALERTLANAAKKFHKKSS